MQLNRSNLALLGVVGVILAVAIGGFLFNQVLSPSSSEPWCAVSTRHFDEAPGNWTVANITDEFLEEWPLLFKAVHEGSTGKANQEEVYQSVQAIIEYLGATGRGDDASGYTAYGNYQDQVYRFTGACAVP